MDSKNLNVIFVPILIAAIGIRKKIKFILFDDYAVVYHTTAYFCPFREDRDGKVVNHEE